MFNGQRNTCNFPSSQKPSEAPTDFKLTETQYIMRALDSRPLIVVKSRLKLGLISTPRPAFALPKRAESDNIRGTGCHQDQSEPLGYHRLPLGTTGHSPDELNENLNQIVTTRTSEELPCSQQWPDSSPEVTKLNMLPSKSGVRDYRKQNVLDQVLSTA
ncbi:hypothetical protein PISMIDRAFT_11778 [Pisolithus microcarpus 441]|uniref:Uncharacterized protein n=1 Tax=Pisolithus microcarpus 441 TaxID=765257 RepID=A0A0C9ZR35_9AGAM|nr:hypothetical protein PISMIDRAFT_19858 [Pisolithus microcarpus 441]KIK22188.1 hypothetical protein PISMIDRAFT_11778 [Pisolithus microcarpus 441]